MPPQGQKEPVLFRLSTKSKGSAGRSLYGVIDAHVKARIIRVAVDGRPKMAVPAAIVYIYLEFSREQVTPAATSIFSVFVV